MKLEIHKKGCNEVIMLAIEPTASVNDLLTMLYEYRGTLLKSVPLDVYQNVVVLHLVDIYSEHCINQLKSGTWLADYDINESSYITLDNFTHDNFFFILNRMSSNYGPSDSPALTRRIQTHFFGEATAVDSQSDEMEYSDSTQDFLIP